MQDWVFEGIKALIAGMGTVFVILIIISFVISMIKHVNFTKKEIVHPVDGLHENKLHLAAVVEKTEPGKDDVETIAAIVGAISAVLDTTQDRFVVRSFKRVERSTEHLLRF